VLVWSQLRTPRFPRSRGVVCQTQPSVTRLGSALSRLPFSAGPHLFPDSCHPSCLLLCCFLDAIPTFLAVPLCLLEVYHHVSATGRFLPPFCKGSHLGNGLAPHSSIMPIILCLHLVVGDRLPHNVLALVLWGLVTRSIACISRAYLRALFAICSTYSSSWIFMAGPSIMYANCLPPTLCDPWIVQSRCGGRGV
jgi:hypothetical protein